MTKKYKTYTADFKLKVAMEAVKNIKTIGQIASEFGLHSSQVASWKKHLLEYGSKVFETNKKKKPVETCEDVALLQQQIGKLAVELEWLKKKHGIA